MYTIYQHEFSFLLISEMAGIAVLIAAAIFSFPAVINAATFYDCATQISTLENALYETGDNIFHLNRIFYPPNTRTSRFARVTYVFLDEIGEEGDCNVTYIWAIGGFNFFQPPTLFMFNSLFFNYPNNDLTELRLELPDECRPLVQDNESSAACSCVHDSERLEILTQQVSALPSCMLQYVCYKGEYPKGPKPEEAHLACSWACVVVL